MDRIIIGRTGALPRGCSSRLISFKIALAVVTAALIVIPSEHAAAWTTNAPMAKARYSHTMTLLTNGSVLVAGGNGTNGYLSSAELYDPLTRVWTDTGALNSPRTQHTATLLPSGKVLAAGGVGLSSAELYDPDLGAWTVTGSLNEPRGHHTATLLLNGKVLVVGGLRTNSAALSSAELYDPATGRWTATGAMSTNRSYHSAALLRDGRVLVAGGSSGKSTIHSSAELYDPVTETWTATGSLATNRLESASSLLPDGTVLVVGGQHRHGNSVTPLLTAEIYNPDTGTWNQTGALNSPRGGHATTLLLEGRVLVTGGGYTNGSYLASAELYDPVTGNWTMLDSMAVNRGSHRATLLPDGNVLVSGGLSTWRPNYHRATNSTELCYIGLGLTNSAPPPNPLVAPAVYRGSSIVITGSQLGAFSATNHPSIHLRGLENGQTAVLPPQHWSTGSFTSAPLMNFLPDHAIVTMLVDEVPSGSSIITVLNPCDLETRVSGPGTLSPGVSFSCAGGLTNLGAGAADNVVVSCSVPSGLAFLSATAGGELINGLVVWRIGTLAAGSGTSFSATFKAPAAGSFTNVVTGESSTPDTNPANHSAHVITTVTGGTFSNCVGRPVLNPFAGDYEQWVTVTNIGNPLVAVRLLVGDLPESVSLLYACGTNDGRPYVDYTVAMDTGDARTFLLLFHNPYRLEFTNTIEAMAVLPPTPSSEPATRAILSRVYMDTGVPDAPRLTFVFSSIAGRSYQILFSDDRMQTWNVADTLRASSNATIWKESLPLAENRLFKVAMIPD